MTNLKKKLYLAGPLFSEAERKYNLYLKNILCSNYSVYLPQEDGNLLVNLVNNGSELSFASKMVFNRDIHEVNNCDILLLIMDGRSIDEGAAFELGYAYSLGKICLGLQTDVRRLLPFGNNPMIENSISKIYLSVNDLLSDLLPHDNLPIEFDFACNNTK
ncbi:MAG: nucleoside 2-deoxyribosyltransferase [Geobacteraceae bacterium]|nr:nucleoside 2-deoxyribosyltransferase [Geobacteraceae bacterium]